MLSKNSRQLLNKLQCNYIIYQLRQKYRKVKLSELCQLKYTKCYKLPGLATPMLKITNKAHVLSKGNTETHPSPRSKV